MDRTAFVCRIEFCAHCGDSAEYLCDAALSDYIIEQNVLSGLRVKLRALYDCDIRDATQAERALVFRQIAGIHEEWTRRLRQAPLEAKTCSLPVCADCALDIGDDRHFCPQHAEQYLAHERNTEQHRQALVARGFGLTPTDGWIRWTGRAHLMLNADALSLACGRKIVSGWRPAHDTERCLRCVDTARRFRRG